MAITSNPRVQHAPKVGDAATWSNGRDSFAATVIKVSPSGHQVTIREDRAIVVSDGEHNGSAKYDYMPDPAGREMVFTRRYERTNVVYRQTGSKWTSIAFGVKRQHRDPHF